MIALKGVLQTLRRERCGPTEARSAAERLAEVLRLPQPQWGNADSFFISLGLCLNALSKHPAVGPDLWQNLAEGTAPLVERMPARQLTLALNAFSRRPAAAAAPAFRGPWLSAAGSALVQPSREALGAQDLALALSAFARLLHRDRAVFSRLVRDDAPQLLDDLAPQGLAAVAQATARLGEGLLGGPHSAGAVDGEAVHVAALLQGVATRVPRHLSSFGPLELALLVDAFTREKAAPGVLWVEGAVVRSALAAAAEALGPPLAEGRLGPQEVVMVLAAFVRHSRSTGTGILGAEAHLATALATAIGRVLPQLPGAELAIAVHAGAQLTLPLADGALGSATGQALVVDAARKIEDPEHLALLLHGLSKLRLQPAADIWSCLIQRLSQQLAGLEPANVARVLLAAAKADWPDSRLRRLAEASSGSSEHGAAAGRAFGLRSLDAEGVASLLYARLHPYYFDRRGLCAILAHIAGARDLAPAQSLDMQVRTALLALVVLPAGELGPAAPLARWRALAGLEARTASSGVWKQGLKQRQSDLQGEVAGVLRQLLCREAKLYPDSGVIEEAWAGPLSVDVLCSLGGRRGGQ